MNAKLVFRVTRTISLSMVLASICFLPIAASAQTSEPQPEDTWTRFLDTLRPASELVHRQRTPQDPLTQAEGYRYLARLIRMGLERSHEFTNTDQPVLFAAETPGMLAGGTTTDGRYQQAFIDGGKTYRVSGQRGRAPLLEFGVYEGRIGAQNTSKLVSVLTEKNLKVKKNGRFEVILSPEEHKGNWIRTNPASDLLSVRQYAYDWDKIKPAELSISRVGAVPTATPLTPHRIEQDLLEAATFVRRLSTTWAYLLERMGLGPPNKLASIPQDLEPIMAGGHHVAGGRFELAADEALLVEFKPPKARYWGLQLTNYWLEPLDYGSNGSHVNNKTASYAKDGFVRLVIAGKDPGASNWLDTKGHVTGTLQFRMARSKQAVPEFNTTILPLSNSGH